MKGLRSYLGRELGAAAKLVSRATARPTLGLKHLIDEFVRLRGRLRNIEKRLAYHPKWQQAIIDYAAYFARTNRTVAPLRKIAKLRKEGGPRRRIAELAQELDKEITGFRPTPRLGIELRSVITAT